MPRREEVVGLGVVGTLVLAVGLATGMVVRTTVGLQRNDRSSLWLENIEDPAAVYRVPVNGSPCRGSADAPVTIVVFEDFECGFCREGQAVLRQLEGRYPGRLRIVFKHNPLRASGLAAANAVEEARRQGGDDLFWKMHDGLLGVAAPLELTKIESLALALGMDVAELRIAIREQRYRRRIEGDRRLALQLDGPATPTFYVNGRKVAGAYPVERFVPLIDLGLRDAAGLVAQGVPAARVYERIVRGGARALSVGRK